MRNAGPERIDIPSQENRLFQICLVACFLTMYIITEQSWLSLINVGSGVHLRLAGQLSTETDIDVNNKLSARNIKGGILRNIKKY